MTDRPVTAYRAYIDAMVERAGYSVAADRIALSGHAERTNDLDSPLSVDEQRRKAALLSMTSEQREAVAELLLQQNVSGIHDAIHSLGDFDFTIDGVRPDDLADGWPSGDFMARLDGYQWSGE